MKRLVLVLLFALPAFLSALIIDHTCVDITQIPESAILAAKDSLHIAYGHTSHGRQIVTEGMAGLVEFANNGGKGLSLPTDIFAWNNGGTDGVLDLHDYAMSGDVGYYPQWVNETRTYLDNPANSDVNVIMWSWCGQVDGHYASGHLWDWYLEPMTELEEDYPEVVFIYMTGHVDIYDDANNKAANDSIRSYCQNHDKVLFDFADFDRHDPDGTYYEFVNDNCDYYDAVGGTLLGNWATEWQNTHTEGVDWYDCGAAHSVSLNANQKAYGAWWMWARLAGWGPAGISENPDSDSDLKLSVVNDINVISDNTIELSFYIPEDGPATIEAYNISGAKIDLILRDNLPAGSHSCSWDRNGKSGVIIIKLKHSSGITSVKLNCI
ncbi:hypothetical protein JW879_06800 [candidate division WOR-3 bacterium]|nr:hypothetical protein [candidate division WOR-3 bacterium]